MTDTQELAERQIWYASPDFLETAVVVTAAVPRLTWRRSGDTKKINAKWG